MRISCPHCKAAYEVDTLIKNAVLVCHRCHTEFSMDERAVGSSEKDAGERPEASLPLFEHSDSRQRQEETEVEVASEESGIPVPAFLAGVDEYAEQVKRENMPVPDPAVATARIQQKRVDLQAGDMISQEGAPAGELNDDSSTPPAEIPAEGPLPPARADIMIWPWLIVMLLVIGSVGFWYKKDAWLDQPWFRSVLINMHLPVEVRNKDWFIIPSSVQGQWLKRDDGSQVLVIQGRVENRLYCELPPPRILVRFFDDTGITDSLGEQLLPITEPPAMEQMKHAPFKMPAQDMVPVEAQGQRGFLLVVESLPERTADFTLSPVAKQ